MTELENELLLDLTDTVLQLCDKKCAHHEYHCDCDLCSASFNLKMRLDTFKHSLKKEEE